MTAPERPGPERPGPDYPPEWDDEPTCGQDDGPHFTDCYDDEDDGHDQRHHWWHPTCPDCDQRADHLEQQQLHTWRAQFASMTTAELCAWPDPVTDEAQP